MASIRQVDNESIENLKFGTGSLNRQPQVTFDSIGNQKTFITGLGAMTRDYKITLCLYRQRQVALSNMPSGCPYIDTHRQTVTDRHTHTQQTFSWTDGWTDMDDQRDGRTDRRTDRDGRTERRADRETDGQKDGQFK